MMSEIFQARAFTAKLDVTKKVENIAVGSVPSGKKGQGVFPMLPRLDD